jgi:hypothetical protein
MESGFSRCVTPAKMLFSLINKAFPASLESSKRHNQQFFTTPDEEEAIHG